MAQQRRESDAKGFKMQEASMPHLSTVVSSQCKIEGAPDDLWWFRVQERVAQEKVPRVEPSQSRLLQGQLSAKKAWGRSRWQSRKSLHQSIPRRPFKVRNTLAICSRGDRGATSFNHWVFGATTHETFSRGVKESTCCKYWANRTTTPRGVFKMRSTLKRTPVYTSRR